MINATLDLRAAQELYPGLHVCFCISSAGTLTFWYDENRVVQHWSTTNWDELGITAAKTKAAQHDLYL